MAYDYHYDLWLIEKLVKNLKVHKSARGLEQLNAEVEGKQTFSFLTWIPLTGLALCTLGVSVQQSDCLIVLYYTDDVCFHFWTNGSLSKECTALLQVIFDCFFLLHNFFPFSCGML